jgi:N utilization substance protein B
MAVQAIFKLAHSNLPAEQVATAFLNGPLREHHYASQSPDDAYFQKLFVGAAEHLEQIDQNIQSFLRKDWQIGRLDTTVLAILRIGFFELLRCLDVPAPLIINAYVHLAHRFFTSGPESGLINAILDAAAKKLRNAP